MHFADIHLDKYYLVGSEADCGDSLCCRDITNNIKESAGEWGTYPCDLPFNTFSFLTEVKANGDEIDLLYYTGDSVPHDLWQYTKNYIINTTKTVSNTLKQFTNKTVIPAVGNHESIPSNWFVIYLTINLFF
jgi:sphingomyelin phosphodiesterase